MLKARPLSWSFLMTGTTVAELASIVFSVSESQFRESGFLTLTEIGRISYISIPSFSALA